jgi:hypothetical protein
MFNELIIRISRALKRNDLPYMIIGGQAVLLYGMPRMTKDIDITLGVNIDELERALKAVKDIDLDVIPEDFRAFAQKTFVLPTRDRNTAIRVDFIFSYTPYERRAIERAKPIYFQDAPVMFASVEDVIIHKVFAGRPRDLEDVHSIILKNPDFDRKYTRKWLRQFDRSMESGQFTRVFEDILKAAG